MKHTTCAIDTKLCYFPCQFCLAPQSEILIIELYYIYLFKESSENLSADEEISDLVSFVQSKVNKPHPEVKVKQRSPPLGFSHLFTAKVKKPQPEVKVKQKSQPLDFSHLFNAIHGRRYRDDSENRITMNLSEQLQSDNL